MSVIFNTGKKESSSSAAGTHNINKSAVLAPTDDQAPSPTNPGNFPSIRSVPVVTGPRYFNREETKAIKKLAKEKKKVALYSKEAYQALKEIDDADTVVHVSHYKYKGFLAGNEVKKLAANASYANKLHALRPSYAKLDSGIDAAEMKATSKIREIKEKIKSQWNK
ncbi:MAG: hypothetical protein F6K35_22345 [Okeania sp. SIO2H7]|nr:hypothetical protein [Okeania sp. SIO2H7]